MQVWSILMSFENLNQDFGRGKINWWELRIVNDRSNYLLKHNLKAINNYNIGKKRDCNKVLKVIQTWEKLINAEFIGIKNKIENWKSMTMQFFEIYFQLLKVED